MRFAVDMFHATIELRIKPSGTNIRSTSFSYIGERLEEATALHCAPASETGEVLGTLEEATALHCAPASETGEVLGANVRREE